MAPPFAAVYFDCDSTLSTIEGVDELLEFADPELRRDIAALTTQAMDGTLPLAEVYESRLSKLAPRREQLDLIGEHYVKHLVPDALATIQALQSLGKHVGIVSGGLLVPVRHLAAHLGVPLDCVHAVPLHFHPDGTARGLVNVFVPLVPTTTLSGPTELLAGSLMVRSRRPGAAPSVRVAVGRAAACTTAAAARITPSEHRARRALAAA